VAAWFYPTTEEIMHHLCRDAQASDVILIMSNGGFDNIHLRLLVALEQVPAQA
jgi:UDP-N-acetylmuramate: L-alanyl-gamma-D-glutamyl-meso-diaminopimelate ligase